MCVLVAVSTSEKVKKRSSEEVKQEVVSSKVGGRGLLISNVRNAFSLLTTYCFPPLCPHSRAILAIKKGRSVGDLFYVMSVDY